MESESEDEQDQSEQAHDARINLHNIHDFLRLIGAGRRTRTTYTDPSAARDNAGLVRSLRTASVATSDSVCQALLICPRGMFIPAAYQDEAYYDAPIRVEEHDFNISAPHMHATALEALDVQPGERVLDVGCGCGLMAAYAAYLVGKSGEVVAMDIKECCVAMVKKNMRTLRAFSSDYASKACEVQLERRNVFMPVGRHQGRYDKVHVGASCPEDRLPLLLQLLRPDNGKLLVPVGSELRLVTRLRSGGTSSKLLSHVRFQDLEVPSDAQIVFGTLEDEVAQRTAITVPPSTLAEDLRAALGPLRAAELMKSAFKGTAGTNIAAAATATTSNGSTNGKLQNGVDNAAGRSGKAPGGGCGSSCMEEEADANALADQDASTSRSRDPAGPASSAATATDPARFAGADAALVGDGWQLPVHSALLASRCDLLRARSCSGMSDARCMRVVVPDACGRRAMEAFRDYVYSDAPPPVGAMGGDELVELLHAACYFGVPRLVALCEWELAADLRQCDAAAAADGAPRLLMLADEFGLQQLRAAALASMAANYDRAAATEAFAAMGRPQVEAVAAELAGRMARCEQLLRELSAVPRAAPRDSFYQTMAW